MIHFTMSMEEERQELGSPQKSANDLFQPLWQADDEKSQKILIQETDHWIIIL